MITANKGEITIKGREFEAMADLSCVIKSVFDMFEKKAGRNTSEQLVRTAVELGFKNEQELDEALQALVALYLRQRP